MRETCARKPIRRRATSVPASRSRDRHMPHRPDEEGLEPEGGGAGERLRQHLDSRYPAGEWPPGAPIEDTARPDDQASTERQPADEVGGPPLSEEFTDEPGEHPPSEVPVDDLSEEFSDEPEEPPEAHEFPVDSGKNEDMR